MTESIQMLASGVPGALADGMGDALGILGLALYLGSYLALQLGLIRGDGYAYPVLNLLAAAGILASLVEAFNIYAAVGEIAWIAISAVGILRLWVLRRYLRLSPDETLAARSLAPGLATHRVRRLLKLGRWSDVRPGQVLATEGAPVGALTFIAAGLCRIEVGGAPVATIGSGGVVGEMTVLSGEPATATVIVVTPARLLTIGAQPLRDFLARNEDVRAEVERSFATDLRRKLLRTTRALSDHRRPNRRYDPVRD